MEARLTNPFAFHHPIKVSIPQGRKHVHMLSIYNSWKFHKRQCGPNRLVIKPQAATCFAEWRSSTGYLQNLTEKLLENSPKSMKKFPWCEAKDVVLGRLLVLAKASLKWCLLGLFAVSSFSDVYFAFSSNKELVVPLGLFMGVALADFLGEFVQDFFHSNAKADINKHFVGIGSLFVLVKLMPLCFNKLQGKVLLLHIGNGGLMQVLWLAQKLQENTDASIDAEAR